MGNEERSGITPSVLRFLREIILAGKQNSKGVVL